MKAGSGYPSAYGHPVHVRQQPAPAYTTGTKNAYDPSREGAATAAHAPPAGVFVRDPERGNAYSGSDVAMHHGGGAPPPGLSAGEQQALDAADKAVRMGFIRKVYAILIVQLLFTFGITAIFTFVESVKDFVQSSPGLFWLAWILSIGFLITLACVPSVARKYPQNYVCLALFTIFEAYLIGVVSSFYDTDAVFIAVGLTIAVFLGLTAFAYQTKIDFTTMSGTMFALLIILILCGILSIFIPALRVVYAGLGALVFSAFIVYDTQLICGGKHRQYQFSIDDYVLAALSLYIDVVQLFLFLLSLLGGGGNE
eukprot:gb/GECG01004863.1/.p1 GENE.gb/GECG01004863.1/~~gb/GECG01004863.1/.p1  ORF type:complete len:311 (+),score=12.27 gb/GECG01004863.1/:1-933(+)